ncbi:MAG: LLM class flavin-dependent oxidoreductase, partial [Acidimicrobiia bacterium]|nr:LLM class flavin-dependent oxidoreductase [Acidimicrobiia bacterium]
MLQTGLLICGEAHRWANTVAQARAAESLGYDSVWVAESHFRDDKDSPAPLIGLAALATVTERVLLGPAVVVAPLQHPVSLAEQTALLQEMSDGRLVCGLGMGHRDDEFAAFEILRSQRRKHLEETVELLRLLWT